MRRSTEGDSRARAVLQLRRWCVAIGQPAAELGGHLPEDDDEIRRVDAIDANPPFGSLPNRPNNGSLYLLVREVDRVAGRQGLGRHRFAMKGRQRTAKRNERNERNDGDSHTSMVQTSGQTDKRVAGGACG